MLSGCAFVVWDSVNSMYEKYSELATTVMTTVLMYNFMLLIMFSDTSLYFFRPHVVSPRAVSQYEWRNKCCFNQKTSGLL